MASASVRLISVNYEVFGKVQGVFFRKYTQAEAAKLQLVGWVMNTEKGTVIGQIQGKEEAVKKMKEWLKKSGSPKSKIERAEFKSEKEVPQLEFTSFEFRK